MGKEKETNRIPTEEKKQSIPTCSFTVGIQDLNKHYFKVRLQMETDAEETVLALPAWTPGSYMIRDYSTHLHKFISYNPLTQEEVKSEQIDLNRWKIKNNKQAFVAEYIIYAFEDYSVRTNYLDSEFGFINPSALFLYPEGNLQAPISVRFETENTFANTFTSLRKEGPHHYLAEDFDELYDSPFHLTNQTSIRFRSDQCEHELLIEGNVPYSFKEKLASDLQKITSKQIEWMESCPNSYYLFVLNLSQPAYGGLEHKASSINFFSPDQIHEDEDYKRLLELLSHEYFHLWNVKRIRPVALGPFDYQSPNLTKELWIAEGVTSFYDIHFLYLAGFLTKEEYLSRIQNDVLSLDDTNAEDWMSLEESSFTAWTKYYKRNGNSHNINVSYYTKGAALVLCMVIFLLKETNGTKSFRDIMLLLYKRYYLEKQRGFTKQEFFDTAKEATGVDLKKEFDGLLTTAKRIPIEEYLKWIGLQKIESEWVADLRFKTKDKNGNLFVQKISHKDDGAVPDLQLEDEIVAINGKRMNSSLLQKLEKQLQPKEKIHVLLSRYGRMKEIILEVAGAYKNRKLGYIEIIPQEVKEIQNQFFKKD